MTSLFVDFEYCKNATGLNLLQWQADSQWVLEAPRKTEESEEKTNRNIKQPAITTIIIAITITPLNERNREKKMFIMVENKNLKEGLEKKQRE